MAKFIEGVSAFMDFDYWHKGRMNGRQQITEALHDRNTFIRAWMDLGHDYADAVRQYKQMMARERKTK